MVLPSADAGPSSMGGHAHAHQAFPTAQQIQQQSRDAQMLAPEPLLPKDAASLWKQIGDARTPALLNDAATVLHVLATPVKGSDHTKRDYLLLDGIDLTTVADGQLPALTLGLVYVLSERLNRRPKHAAQNLELALRLCVNGSAELFRLASPRVTEFAWAVLRAAQSAKETALPLGPLQHLLSLSNNGSYFNGVHAVFLEACLLLRNLALGYQSLGILYSNVVPGTSVVDVLTYYHHAGTVAAAAGDFARASELFTFAAAIPGETASAIRLACAKRAVLCELLNTGKQIQFPKDISQNVNRMVDKGMEAYIKLAKAFEAGQWAQARDVASAESALNMYDRDCNRGLVIQILGSIPKRCILHLRKTYSRLTLADLAGKVQAQPEAITAAINDMVLRGEIRATIDGSPEIVTFMDDDDYASPEQMIKLAQAHALAQSVNTDLLYSNRAMLLNKKLLAKRAQTLENKDKRATEPIKSRGEYDYGDDIGPAVRGVGSNYADMGF